MDNLLKIHGGKRLGAGRKTGTGKFKEPTEVLRVPASQKSVIADFLRAYQAKQLKITDKYQLDSFSPDFERVDTKVATLELPLFTSKVAAGLPSPADDHLEKRLSVNDYLIEQAETTFFVTIVGESMRDAGLLSGDKAVINRAKLAAIGDIVLAIVDNEFTIKTLGRGKNGLPRLIPANPDFKTIEIKEGSQFEVWGVVTGSFRRYR